MRRNRIQPYRGAQKPGPGTENLVYKIKMRLIWENKRFIELLQNSMARISVRPKSHQ